VRGIAKLPIVAALAALLLAIGFAACGGGEGDSGSTASQAPPTRVEGKPNGGGGSAHFVPKHHHDSGGGSRQFRVKGGDNSIEEFGSEAEPPERNRAAVVLHDFLDARAVGDWAAACSYLASSVIESFQQLGAQAKKTGGDSCAGILEKLANPAAKQALKEEAAQADVGSLRIEGERAFIIYTGLGGTAIAMPMAHEGGAWKVASLAGTPLS